MKLLWLLCLTAVTLVICDGWASSDLYLNVCNTSLPRQRWTPYTNPNVILLAVGVDPDTDCLDCNLGNTPHTWNCDPKNPNVNQVWTYDINTPKSLLKATDYPLCLAQFGSYLGSTIMMAPCKPNDPLQQWTYDKQNLFFRSGADNTLCLDGGSDLGLSCNQPPLSNYPYCNPALDVDTRIADLVPRLSLLEKASMLQNSNIGSKRFGIPPLPFSEALHGVVSGCGKQVDGNTGCPTSFPHALLLGATFNASLWREVGSAISTEARALNNQGISGLAYWAPDINLFRDPRWGRGQEVPGEDPFLTGEYVMHWTRGMQEGDDPRYLKVVSTAKHFADYDLEGNGGVDRTSFDALVSDKDQVEYYWPAFRAAIEGAHIKSIMCSYNAINGVPACGNDLFMNEVARNQWQFDGFIVSDCGAIGDGAFQNYICKYYNCSADYTVRQGLTGGCDLNCGSFYVDNIPAAVQNQVVSLEDIDLAVTRVWKHAILLGMLDPSVSYRNIGPDAVDTPFHRALAQSAAEQGIVLLKNENNLLPINPSGTKVAVIGPHFNASQDMLSIYRGDNSLVNSHTPYLALVKRGFNVIGYAQGCQLSGQDTSGFAAATALASKADVALVFVGLHPGQGGGDAREDEGWDRSEIILPGVQSQLIQAVHAANSKTVVVLIHGGPLAIEWEKNNVPAIVDAFYPGELGGDAIARILAGDVSPAGRLPNTIYPANFISARPISDMNLRDNGGVTYRYYTGAPLWEFGFGLSYTTFNYSIEESETTKVVTVDSLYAVHPEYYRTAGKIPNAPAQYTVLVTNTGKVESDNVVLGFVSSTDPDAPLKELFGYARVHLSPGEKTIVYFTVPPQVISLVNDQGEEEIRPGLYQISIGDPLQYVHAVLKVVGEPKMILSLPKAKDAYRKRTSS